MFNAKNRFKPTNKKTSCVVANINNNTEAKIDNTNTTTANRMDVISLTRLISFCANKGIFFLTFG
ncbi:hypothetical protein J1TS3_14010 [Siminovitchia fordii]|uniref:Uncharacterized protein n=1 Tax=Siminovitchia fordii TaxID=254759 RepID=A0ABQ4K503_9BACI|nr:hypothetical protein J1TS3_14010 [Siminovitchia fordii]